MVKGTTSTKLNPTLLPAGISQSQGVYKHHDNPLFATSPTVSDTLVASPCVTPPASVAAVAPSHDELLQQWHAVQAQAHMAVLQQGNHSDAQHESQKRSQQAMAMAITGSPAKLQRVVADSADAGSHRQQFLNLLHQQSQQMKHGDASQ